MKEEHLQRQQLRIQVITYNNTGDFKVTLTATNADGSNTKVVDNFIVVNTLTPPVVNFDADNTSVKVGSSVQFTDLVFQQSNFSGTGRLKVELRQRQQLKIHR